MSVEVGATSDAAERLQQDILNAAISGPDWDWDEAAATKVADQALAAERRATVEPYREDIRTALNGHESDCSYFDGGYFTCSCGYDAAGKRVEKWLDALDAEAER